MQKYSITKPIVIYISTNQLTLSHLCEKGQVWLEDGNVMFFQDSVVYLTDNTNDSIQIWLAKGNICAI